MHLMLSARVSFDATQRELTPRKAGRPRAAMHRFSFQLNGGILNLNYRPGYAYTGLEEIDGSQTDLVGYWLGGHRWAVNGWRFQTRLEYTNYRPNGNGHRVSYLWDALHAPGNHESLHMASHRICYTLLVGRRR